MFDTVTPPTSDEARTIWAGVMALESTDSDILRRATHPRRSSGDDLERLIELMLSQEEPPTEPVYVHDPPDDDPGNLHRFMSAKSSIPPNSLRAE